MAEDKSSLPQRTPRRDPYRLVSETFDGRYRLEEFAGMGSFGAVYRATATRVGRTVAVKILKPDLGEDETAGARELFQREALTAGRLSHRHIVAVIDVGEHEGFAYLVMEWLDGRTLEQEMRGRTPLSPEETETLLAEISDALQYAHDSGVIHRDIKPSNIHLGQKDRPFVKMLDFGIAKVISSSTAVAASRIAGTVSYMSPEQITGSAINHRSDIYSLGIVLYQMLTGTLPFVGESHGHIIQQHIAAPPPLLSNVRPDLPYALSGVIQRALAKNPEDRQRSATELSQDFSAAIRSSNQPTEVYRPQQESGAHPHPALPPTQVAPEQRNYAPHQQPEPPQGQYYYPTAPAGGGTGQNPYAPPPYRNELPPTQVAPPPDWIRQQPPAYQPPPVKQTPPAVSHRKSRNLLTFAITSASVLLLLILLKTSGERGDLLLPIPALLTALFLGFVIMGLRVLIKKGSNPSPVTLPPGYRPVSAAPAYQSPIEAESRGRYSMALFALGGAFLFFLISLFFKTGYYLYSSYGDAYYNYPGAINRRVALPIFGAMLGITISAFREAGVWSVRPGKRVKSYLAHGAIGAAALMAIPLIPTPEASLALALFSFPLGLIVCGVRIIIQKLKRRKIR
jgi:serine/threonine protein kinase